MEEPAKNVHAETRSAAKKRLRDGAGRFLTGCAPGPGGPRKDPDLRAECRLRTPSDLARLDTIIANSKDGWLVLDCIKLRWQYGYGKPVTAHFGGPLVNINMPGAGEPPRSPESAYQAMLAGAMPLDPDHEAFTAPRRAAARSAAEAIEGEAAVVAPADGSTPGEAPDGRGANQGLLSTELQHEVQHEGVHRSADAGIQPPGAPVPSVLQTGEHQSQEGSIP